MSQNCTVRPKPLYPNEPDTGDTGAGHGHGAGGDEFFECDEGAEADEARAPRRLHNPAEPRKEEREEHCLTGRGL